MDAASKTAPRFQSKRFNAWLARRIPPGQRITLSQANVFIFPTRSGFMFGGLLFILILGAINYQNSLVYGVAFLLGSMFIITILYTFRNLSGLSVELAETHSGFVGEDIEFAVRVERPKGRGREGIQIGWPEGFKQWVEIFDTEAAVVSLYVAAQHRGWLRPGRLLVETYYPLGLLRAWTWVDINARGLIYPKPIFNETPSTQSSSHRDDGVLIDPLGSDDFVDIRDYAPGDPIKNILWRSYARTDNLVVKRYASYVEPRLWFDFAALAGDTEQKLSRLAGLAIQATQSEREFGVRLPNMEIPPGLGQLHLDWSYGSWRFMASQTASSGVGVSYQIPRNSLALLMVSQIVVLVPLAIHISPWIVAVCFICGYWRSQVYQGRWGYPSSVVKTFLVIASVVGITFSGYSSFSLEAATSLLVLAFALKLLEMKNRRDAYLVIYLSYFLIATAFLFDQSMTLTAYEVIASVVVTAAMVGLNQLQSRVRPMASMRVAASLIFQALPLTLVLFLLFPRVAPLWSIPMPSATTTGISDKLTPGDVANLTQSDELAFRVVFEDEVPAQRDLYWRGLVYSEFKYGSWSVAEPLPTLPKPKPQGAGLGYEVFLEPTQAKWLFSLDTPVDYGKRIGLLADYRLINPEPVLSVLRYRLLSDDEFVMDRTLDPFIEARETALPANDNPQLRAYADELYARTGSAEGMIEAMLSQIRQAPYSYTLRPPRLPPLNSIDEFWFETKRGFCTHYAGALVFALRSVGIPARVVGGYQGGELNSVTGHVVVRQYQAHAWAEVWLPGKGWTRYDPTAAVAPARVESGLSAALSSEDRETLSFLTSARFGNEDALNQALQFFDSLEHRWNLWVVGYDAASQASVLKDLLGKVSPMRISLALLVGGGLSMALVTAALFFRRRPRQRNLVERLFQNFCMTMSRHGFSRSLSETPAQYITRLAKTAQVEPSFLVGRLQAHLYNPNASPSLRDIAQLRREFRKLRFRLAFGQGSNAS